MVNKNQQLIKILMHYNVIKFNLNRNLNDMKRKTRHTQNVSHRPNDYNLVRTLDLENKIGSGLFLSLQQD